jgi:hypothetical protein
LIGRPILLARFAFSQDELLLEGDIPLLRARHKRLVVTVRKDLQMSELTPFLAGTLLGPVQRRLILHLLKNGPKSSWGISEKIALSWAECERDRTDYKYDSHGTIKLRLKELIKKGFLEFRESEEVERLASWRGFLHLTVFGLSALCVRLQDRLTELRRTIAASYDHWQELLPLILGKWDLFLSEDVDDLACSNLLNASHLMIREYYAFLKSFWEWVTHKRQREKIAEPAMSTEPDSYGWLQFSSGPKKPGFPSNTQQLEAFNLRFFSFDNPRFKAADTERWLQTCRKDADILAYLKEHLQDKVDGRKLQIERLQANLELLDQ